jgi:glucose/arabinose dehydrogenase
VRRALVIVLGASALFAACGSGNGGSTTTAGGTSASVDGPPTASAARGVRLKRIGRFQSPVYVTSPPGDRHHLFVVEQEGRVRVITDGKASSMPFLDIRSQVTSGGEQGLLSIAFPPDYAGSGRFYVYFTDRSEDERIVEFQRASAERADAGSERLVLRMADPQANHNGGLLLFGPDKHLYVGTGDGGGAGDQHGPHGNAQNLASPLGKILRIDPAQSGDRPYTVPSSNPFVGRAGARPEIYAYGLRNPWRYSFDRRTGDLTIGDVGQDAVEEIDFVRRGHGRGANFGWRVFEGRSRYTPGETAPGAQGPALVRLHRDGNCSITGGLVVRDRSLSGLHGRYLFGDYCKGQIQSARVRGRSLRGVHRVGIHVGALSSFGQDGRGRVYVTSLGGGVYRLVQR